MSKWVQINLCPQAMRYEMLTFAYENTGHVNISINILRAFINGLKVLLAGLLVSDSGEVFSGGFV